MAAPVSVLGEDVVAEDSEEPLGGGGAGVAVESLGRMLGEAEGDVRSLLSVQPASTPTASARTPKPVSNFFIMVPPSRIRNLREELQWGCRQRTACGTLSAWRREITE